MQKVTSNTQSELLLNIKDIEKAKSSNINTKIDNHAKTIDASLEKYNQKLVRALEAPIPAIKLPFSEVLLRAVPIEVKTRSGIILNLNENDYQTADKLETMSKAISQTQEILMVGGLITDEEQEKTGIKPGNICKFRLDRFRTISDRNQNGIVKTEYTIPSEEIDGYTYLIIEKRDIIFTREK